ncbi:MAG: HEAT repeat domain-containing protein, partial [Microcoleaceae cyanobacterium]
EIGSEVAVEPLIAALEHEDIFVRRSAARALGEIGSEVAVEPLIAALEHEDSDIRSNAASALGEIGSEVAVEALITALEDEDSDIRSNAASALGEIGSEVAVEALITALENEDSDIRSNAAEALGQMGTAEVLKQLIQNPTINIYESDLFALARKLAIQYSKKNLPFIPVYPKLVKYSPLKVYIQSSSRIYKILIVTWVIYATFVTLHFSGIYSLPFLRESQPEQSSP